MQVIRDIDEFRAARHALGGTVAFVPTMGALHAAHESLMELALEHADHLVVSIFVNPTQFDRAEDLQSYPRDEAGDLAVCRELGASIVLIPEPEAMYVEGTSQPTKVIVEGLTDNLCGRARPGHFDGVATVVAKLYNIVEPDVAIFGQKDYQQLAVLKRMTADMNFPIEVIGAATGREPDGLAISSRNRLLTDEQRLSGLSLSRGLVAAWRAFQSGVNEARRLEALARRAMEEGGVRPDYSECVHPDSLQMLDTVGSDGAVLALAGFLGEVRLIDNLRLDAPLPAELPAELA